MEPTFQQQVLIHLPRLTAYAMTLTRNRSDAEDLVQTTAFLALRSESQFIVGTIFTGWIYRILKNRFISERRGSARRPISLDGVHESVLSRPSPTEDVVLAGEVIKTMEQLNPKLKKTLLLICGDNLSYQEAATALSCSVGTVKSRLWRAREHMKSLLSDNNPSWVESAEAA